MSPQRPALILTLIVVLAACAGVRARDEAVSFSPTKLVVGDPTGIGSGAKLEIFGKDGGLALVTTGGVTRESFVTAFQRNSSGLYQKSMSISTVWADPNPWSGFAVTRYNSTFMDGGVQRDDIALQTYGDHGAIFFADDSSAASAPGRNTLKVKGRLQVNAVDVEAQFAALEARIRQLEGRR